MTEFTFWGELKGEVQKQFSMSLGKAVNKTRRNSNDSSMVLCIMGQSYAITSERHCSYRKTADLRKIPLVSLALEVGSLLHRCRTTCFLGSSRCSLFGT